MFRVPQLPSDSSLNGPAPRSCEFSFEIPSGSRLGDGIPPTLCVMPCDSRRGGLSVVEKAEVSYRVTAVGTLRYVGDQRDAGSSHSFSSGHWHRLSVYGRFQYRAGIMARNASYTRAMWSVPLHCGWKTWHACILSHE
ncbi:hypothetical protein F4604DRAFT_1105455 [Suillus subluteus]|nr:hypothetical protein F4604DRAFT_1105455 [Suillus subluteus]